MHLPAARVGRGGREGGGVKKKREKSKRKKEKKKKSRINKTLSLKEEKATGG